ncbi:MAG TPA: DUF4142 domain-containing protein [Myxococcales bacterium]|jgi:putative membrane protein|nr:DUF4142 domain-containing protein [Myxococcales bacterium]
MSSTGSLGKLLPAAVIGIAAAFAVGSGCKSSTASGSAGAGMGGADGGTGTMSGSAETMADAGSSMGRDVAQGADAAAGTMAAGAQAMEDAGAAAGYGASTDAGGSDMDAGTSESAGGASISDPQIAAVAVAANQVDIDAGKLAKSKSKNSKVKKFADDMIRDHGSANKQAVALVKKLGVTPEENDTSKSITQGGKDNIANLKTMKGKEFDKAYADHEVAYHQQVLEALDKTLIPSAQNAELKSLLQAVRAVVAQHLDHASALADSLSK